MNTDQMPETGDLLFAMQQRNLVYNYNFLNYSNQSVNTVLIYGHPDGWVYQDTGTNGSIGFDPSSNSCMITKSTGSSLMTFTQTINEFPRWADLLCGRKVSACAVIKVPGTLSAEVSFSLTDGMSTSSKTVYFNPGEQQEISISLDVSAQARTLVVSVACASSGIVLYISKVYANAGAVALESLPCIVSGTIGGRRQYLSSETPPATELSLCKASAELPASCTRLNSYLNGRFGKGPNGNSLLPDMRGYFSRAWNNGATTDPDAANRTALGKGAVTGDHTGTVEQDQFREHTHQLQFDLNGQIPAGPSAAMPSINKTFTSDTGKAGGAETRSKNISELYTIKWA
jgi:hypothetical protein